MATMVFVTFSINRFLEILTLHLHLIFLILIYLIVTQ